MRYVFLFLLMVSGWGYGQNTAADSTKAPVNDYVRRADLTAKVFTNLLRAKMGTCAYGDCENGFGIADLPKGEEFVGFFQDGVGTGFSQINSADGETEIFSNYSFSTGKQSGLVIVFVGDDGSRFLMNYDQGIGLGYYPDRQRYGYFRVQNKKVQPATTIHPNGEDYYCVGGDCRNGFGVYRFNNNDVYVGQFRNGRRHGIGQYTYANGHSLMGEFIENSFEGRGLEIRTQYHYYFGDFKKGRREGKGVLRLNKDDYQAGTWKDNELIQTQPKQKTTTKSTTPSTVNVNSKAEFMVISATETSVIENCKGDKECLSNAYVAYYDSLSKSLSEAELKSKLATYIVQVDAISPEQTLGVIMKSWEVPLILDYLPKELQDRLKQ